MIEECRVGTPARRVGSETTGKIFGTVAKGAGIVDAGLAWKDAYDNPSAGSVTKAVFKTAMIFVRTNPVANVVLSVMDMTGLTDALFDW